MNFKTIAKSVVITAATSLSLIAVGTVAQPNNQTNNVTTVQAAGRTIAKSWRGRYMSNAVQMSISARNIRVGANVGHVGSYKKVKNGWYRINFTNYRAFYLKYYKSSQIMALRFTPRSATYYFFKQA